jgi:uncharacterized SAM-binding protein YcdF (DUF218 family)
MLYFISFVVTFLLAPFHWILVLISWAFLTKRVKRKVILLRLAVLIFILFSNEYVYNLANKCWQPKPVVLAKNSNYEAGILLGGMMANALDGNAYFTGASDRFIQTVQLYHSGVIQKVIVSGGLSPYKNGRAEGKSLQIELLESGVAASDIIVESASVNTYENGVFSKRLIDSLQLKPSFVLITSAMHMPRAEKVFKKLGVQVIPFPCDFKSTLKKTEFKDVVYPNIEVLNNWRYLIKEIVGTWGYQLTGKA